jgi:hypothetical protein
MSTLNRTKLLRLVEEMLLGLRGNLRLSDWVLFTLPIVTVYLVPHGTAL